MNSDIDLQGREDLGIAERAAAWLSKIERGGPEEHAAFAAWLKESPRHVEEVLFASAVGRAIERFDPGHSIDVNELLAESGINVLPLAPRRTAPASASNRRASKLKWGAAGLAASAAALGVMLTWQSAIFDGGWQRYSTDVGEQRTVRLADGSLIQLNTQSAIRVHFHDQGREIRLEGGEALFKVEHDPARPFRVLADRATIQALGTQFNVYRRTNEIAVAVLEGKVGVSDALRASVPGAAGQEKILGAGEEALVDKEGGIVKRSSPPEQQIAAWRQRRLVFVADTLGTIAEEFNRYNRVPKIRIEGEAIRDLRFTGVFDADDPMSLVQLLGKDRDLLLERQVNALVIKSRF